MADATAAHAPKRYTILDLGPQRGKKIKQLVQGHGDLLDEINDATAHLREEGKIPRDSHLVIVIVQKKRKKRTLPRLSLPCF